MDGFNELFLDAKHGDRSDTVVTLSFRRIPGLSFDASVRGTDEIHVVCNNDQTYETTVDISDIEEPVEAKTRLRSWAQTLVSQE